MMMSGGGRHPDSGSSALWNFDDMRLQGEEDEGLRGLPVWPYRDLRTPPPDSPAAMTGEGPRPSASLVSIRGVGIARCQAWEGAWGVYIPLPQGRSSPGVQYILPLIAVLLGTEREKNALTGIGVKPQFLAFIFCPPFDYCSSLPLLGTD